MRRIDHDVTTSTLFLESSFLLLTIMIKSFGGKARRALGRVGGSPQAGSVPEGAGGPGAFANCDNSTENPPHLKNGGRGRAQWPGRKLPPANINPPYVWLDGEKHVTNMHFYGYTTRINAKTAIWGGAPREIRGRIEIVWGRIKSGKIGVPGGSISGIWGSRGAPGGPRGGPGGAPGGPRGVPDLCRVFRALTG